jgi:hypothetical protein
MNREIIMQALFGKLTSAPLVFNFTADTGTGSITLGNVSDVSGLMVGMPVMGDGLPIEATIATITPTVTVSLPAIADRTASPMTQGFQTAVRRLRDANAEQDMPALYLVELNEVHPDRGSNEPAMVDINCEAYLFTRVAADQNQDGVPIAGLNALIDGIERALYPTPAGYRQNLNISNVLFCRIEGEVQKDVAPTANGIIGALIPLKIRAKIENNYILS